MSDFLEQIITRNFGATAEIRPRPTARFETPAGAMVPGGEAPMAEETRQFPASPLRPTSPRPDSVPMIINSVIETQDVPVYRAEVKQPLAGLRQHPRAQRFEAEVIEHPTLIHPIRLPPVTGKQGLAALHTQSLMAAERVLPDPTVADHMFPDPVRESKQKTMGMASINRAEGVAPTILQPVVPEPARPMAGRTEVPRIPQPQLSVHVTIGRIEVTVPPPAPPRPAISRPAPPPLKPAYSLDDYLRQRNGGRR